METETKPKQRGGKREGAGRKSTHGGDTKTIRVSIELLPAIRRLQNNETSQIDNVTQSNNAQELETLKQANYKIVLERDACKAELLIAKNKIETLKQEPRRLKSEIDRLKKLETCCQAIKANGEQCTNPAKVRVNHGGYMVFVCVTHYNKIQKQN